jgi:hypothetical protein
MDSSPTKRFEDVKNAGETESIDPSGRLVVVWVTEHGKTYLAK